MPKFIKKMYKSRTDKMIDGVCGGIAEYLEMDSNVVRALFLICIFVGFIGPIAYIIFDILLEKKPLV